MITLLKGCILLLITTNLIANTDQCPAPSPCTCSGNSIYCNYKQLTAVPSLIGDANTNYRLLIYSNPNLIITDHSFSNITLEYLDLDNNNNMTISNNAFRKQSQTLKDLSMRNANLKKVPQAFKDLDILETLNIEDNEINQWDFKIMEKLGVNLTHLDVSNTRLTQWPVWLKHMWNLNWLDISNNRFVEIPRDAFRSFHTKLKYLNIEGTDITEMPIGLETLHELTELHIGGSSINDSSFYENWLPAHKSSLKSLYIQNARITNVPPGLREQRSLTSLNFQSSKLEHVHEENMPLHLTSLNLRDNKLTHIDGGICSPQLTSLVLWNNKIKNIEKHDLYDCRNLHSIDLDGNGLEYISPTAFTRLKQLTSLDIRNNMLVHVPKAIQHLPSLSTLSIQNNPLDCTCQDEWFQQWIQNIQSHLTVDGQCANLDINLKDFHPHCSGIIVG